ncbi:FUSC family protein [Dactylosporangium matsuzakiense]|uniref:FUSC family protein n=1 Tax=Dactylosporangium matsuzakiense TaxID=53360 RepID=UPI0021C47107|nr:FUSC family protein [Dactylosporangium matsuzakiense]UWZ41987.1 FUSC family protein [Dactylosporangium matsuzakiense]
MRNITAAATGFAPVLATVATLIALTRAAHLGIGIVVLGAAVSLMATRSTQRHSPWRLLLVPVGAVVIATFAVLFHEGHAYGDAFFVVTVAAATAARAFGPAAGRLGRALVLPLIGMLIAPVNPGGHPLRTLAWATLAVFIAECFVLLKQRLWSTPEDEAEPPSTSAARIHVWRGVQSALALTMAFTIGQTVFGDHWAWTVISAYTVGAAARSRGDALLKGVHRTLGALGGTAVATVLAYTVGGHQAVAVTLLITILAVGYYLRQFAYAWWAACMTAALALLYPLVGFASAGTLTLLGTRLLAVVIGALCAILPATLIAPIRTGAVLRKRTAECLRSIRDGEYAPALRRLAALREAAAPLYAVRRVHARRELQWVDALTALEPHLRTLADDADDPAALKQVRRTLGPVADDLRAAAGRSSPLPAA